VYAIFLAAVRDGTSLVQAYFVGRGCMGHDNDKNNKLAGDESNGVLNRESSGADPSPTPNSFQRVYAIFLAAVRDGTSWLRRIRWTEMRGYMTQSKNDLQRLSPPQRRQHIFWARVIAERLAYVDEEVFVSWREHKATAELHGIFAQLVLFVSGGLGAAAGLRIFPAEKMEQGSALEADSFIGFALVVNQKRKMDAGFFAEEAGVFRVAQADHGQAGAFLPKC
jgi:hypothetical protein